MSEYPELIELLGLFVEAGGQRPWQIPQHLHDWLPEAERKGYLSWNNCGRQSLLGPGRKVWEEFRSQSAEAQDEGQPVGMSWQQAAERMERLRIAGESFPSQGKLAERFGCSSGTINKAIHSSSELQAWAKVTKSPKAQSLNAVVTDHTAQNRERNPEDEAAIREFIEKADAETRAWFLSLSPADQVEHVNDPDRYSQILGREP